MIAAIVPAAGLSVRMGRPKLSLPIDGGTVIAAVIGALWDGGVDRIVVVVPPRGVAGQAELVRSIGSGVHIIEPEEQPPDMRASVEIGVRYLSDSGEMPDAVLLAPGDLVGATDRLVARVIDATRENRGRIVVPVVKGKRGHPVALPWPRPRHPARFPETWE